MVCCHYFFSVKLVYVSIIVIKVVFTVYGEFGTVNCRLATHNSGLRSAEFCIYLFYNWNINAGYAFLVIVKNYNTSICMQLKY